MKTTISLKHSFSEVAQAVAGLMYTMILESNGPVTEQARFSYVAFSPVEIIKTIGTKTVVIKDDCVVFESEDNPFTLLESKLTVSDEFEWGGFLSYESCRWFQDYSFVSDDTFPSLCFIRYKHVVVYDRVTSILTLHSDDVDEAMSKLKMSPIGTALTITPSVSKLSYDTYCSAISKIKDYISAGDVYQINYTYPLESSFDGDLFLLYQQLNNHSHAPYSSFMRTPETCIISNSPELFISQNQLNIYTKPIKGTRPRGKTRIEDTTYCNELKSSIKDQAELLMIVDLERNDLNKICEVGTVKVDSLFDIESYSYVYQQSASISGRLKKTGLVDVLGAVFPGGSITGAPKIRAMELISQLETFPRRVYTGGVGFFSKQRMMLSIAIRTLYTVDSTLVYHVGGGIVADSDPDEEWKETKTKGAAIETALNFFSKET